MAENVADLAKRAGGRNQDDVIRTGDQEKSDEQATPRLLPERRLSLFQTTQHRSSSARE